MVLLYRCLQGLHHLHLHVIVEVRLWSKPRAERLTDDEHAPLWDPRRAPAPVRRFLYRPLRVHSAAEVFITDTSVQLVIRVLITGDEHYNIQLGSRVFITSDEH